MRAITPSRTPQPARGRQTMARTLAACLLAISLGAHAQYANDDIADWKEDAVPPPPASILPISQICQRIPALSSTPRT